MIRVSEQLDFVAQSYGVLGNLRLNTLRLCAFALIKSVSICANLWLKRQMLEF